MGEQHHANRSPDRKQVVCWRQQSIDETIRYWRNEQAAGESYYGDENEAASVP